LEAPAAMNSCGTFLRVHILVDCGVGRRAVCRKQQQHFFLLDELAHLLDGPGRAVSVVEADELDVAAVDAAVGIDLLEIGELRLAHGAERRHRAAVWMGLADLDLGIGDAWAVLLLRTSGPRDEQQSEESAGDQLAVVRVASPCMEYVLLYVIAGNDRSHEAAVARRSAECVQPAFVIRSSRAGR
jgi:hypothetical protein